MTATNLSISEISSELQFTRETVRKRLADAGIKPAGTRKSYPTYRLRDVVRVLFGGVDADPNRLDPFRRKAHFQAEQAELALQLDREEVILRSDAEEKIAAAFKPISLCLETLPDVLERDVGLTPAQVQRAERAIDELREGMHAAVLKSVKKAKQVKNENVRKRR